MGSSRVQGLCKLGHTIKLESELKHNGVHEANIKSPRTNARGRVRGQGQIFEAEAEDKILASRTAWPRGLNITAQNK